MSALEATGLSRRFGGLWAVRDVSLRLEVGTLHAVIGPNGAGKSTLVALLSGALPPTEGTIRVGGTETTGWPAWRMARVGVGRSFQKTNVMAGMTVLENVRLGAQAHRVHGAALLRRQDRASRAAACAALERAGLADAAQAVAGTLSHGRLRQLEIAMALSGEPRVLLLDEPLAGMGPEESERLAALLKRLSRDHAVLLIEHDMDVVFAVADHMTVMVDGRVLERGPPAAIRASAAVRDAYLGHAV